MKDFERPDGTSTAPQATTNPDPRALLHEFQKMEKTLELQKEREERELVAFLEQDPEIKAYREKSHLYRTVGHANGFIPDSVYSL